jgi:hypothetical protein
MAGVIAGRNNIAAAIVKILMGLPQNSAAWLLQ